MQGQLADYDPIKSLWEGVIPERVPEVANLLDQHKVQFRALEDQHGFVLHAGAYGAIQYTTRSLRQLWLFGYGGMLSLHCYSSFVTLLRHLGQEFRISEIDSIHGQEEAWQILSRLMGAIEELKEAYGEADFNWPETIPDPMNGKPADNERALVFDLTCVAATYITLHELKHVIFWSEGNAPADPWQEESACDAFAQEMILGRIETYCEQSGFPEEQVKTKRAMGIALALMYLLFVTPRQRVLGSETHPPLYARWHGVISDIDLEEDGYFWLYFSSMAISMLRFKGVEVPPIPFVSCQDLSYQLVRLLEDGI